MSKPAPLHLETNRKRESTDRLIRSRRCSLAWGLLVVMVVRGGPVCAQSADSQKLEAEENAKTVKVLEPEVPATAVPLNPAGTVLLDKDRGRVLLRTKVCLREGVLEMFICPRQTKEHESVLSLDAKSELVHAGLLAIGAKPGHPARLHPEYAPAAGDQIDIFVNWIDTQGKMQRSRAQDWVRHSTSRYFEAPLKKVPEGVSVNARGGEGLRYDDVTRMLIFYGPMTPEKKKELLSLSSVSDYQAAIDSLFEQGRERGMQADFIFAGSVFHRRPDGTEVYTANGGSLICVANFGDATIDVNVKSTSSNDAGLLFEPWTERVPPLGTSVLVELVPVQKSESKGTAPAKSVK